MEKEKRWKKVVVTYFGDDWNRKIPLAKAKPTRVSFEDWHRRGLNYGIKMYRASWQWFDKTKGVFSKAWAYRENRWKKIEEEIKPDLIFDKTKGARNCQLFDEKMEAVQKGLHFFNHPLFRISVDNKLVQYLILSEFMPASFLTTDKDNWSKAMEKIKSRKVVVKPLHGSGGFGIIIEEKDKINFEELEFPVLIQEFVETQKGIPGFYEGESVADLRLIYMNHKIIYALSRVAQKGSLFTNFHQGATALSVPLDKIPINLKKMADKIVNKLKIFPEANYSLDFVFTKQGKPLLIEMNSTPGFDLLQIVGDEETKKKNFEEFVKIVKKSDF